MTRQAYANLAPSQQRICWKYWKSYSACQSSWATKHVSLDIQPDQYAIVGDFIQLVKF